MLLIHKCPSQLDPSHQCHNASNKYPTMQYFITEMCTHVTLHIYYKMVQCGIWDYCILGFMQQVCYLINNRTFHDGVIAWKHFVHVDIKGNTKFRIASFVKGIHWSPVDSPSNALVMRNFVFSLLSTWTNCWTNSRQNRHILYYNTPWREQNKCICLGVYCTSDWHSEYSIIQVYSHVPV